MSDAVCTDDGCRLWAMRTGHGPPLVLCHGGPGLWDMFDDLAAVLAEVACVVRWDLPRSSPQWERGAAGELP